jgi:hypothetical protein
MGVGSTQGAYHAMRLGLNASHGTSEPWGPRQGAGRYESGAPGRTRTADAGLRTASLCPLSYGGAVAIVPRLGRMSRNSAARSDVIPYGRRASLRRPNSTWAPVAISGPRRHPRLQSTARCTTTRSAAFGWRHMRRERMAARLTGATLVDLSAVTCPTDPCPPVVGSMPVYRDHHHLTATFARSLVDELGAALPVVGDGSPRPEDAEDRARQVSTVPE